ncbi:MAG: pyridoxal phosphate-dependent aminotransferase [Bryobacterales bacterium]|nr:pyridoxal phosphate-dependent aminotransferase [Bryobacterales bacterium]
MAIETVSPPLASRVRDLRPTAVNRVLAEVRAAQARGVRTVSLMRGEPDLPTPAHIVEAAARSLRDGRTGYPDNRGELAYREAVALKLERDNRLRYDPATEILATSGATFGIYAALMAVLDPGGEVLLPDPIYDAYASPIRLAGGVPVRVPCPLRGLRFELHAEAVAGQITARTRALLLNTPWNPTGTVFGEGELRAIARVVMERNLWLLSDEIYEAFTYGGARHLSPVAAAPELRPRTILINALSKAYSMTGWRVGYCAAPPEVASAMLLVLQQSSRGPATFVQDAATEALRGAQDAVEAMRRDYDARRALVLERLAGMSACHPLPPEGGFFVMASLAPSGCTSDEVRRRLLEEHGVVVIHGAAYGACGEGTLRVSFAAGGEALSEGLARLRAGLEAIAAE